MLVDGRRTCIGALFQRHAPHGRLRVGFVSRMHSSRCLCAGRMPGACVVHPPARTISSLACQSPFPAYARFHLDINSPEILVIFFAQPIPALHFLTPVHHHFSNSKSTFFKQIQHPFHFINAFVVSLFPIFSTGQFSRSF